MKKTRSSIENNKLDTLKRAKSVLKKMLSEDERAEEEKEKVKHLIEKEGIRRL
jgi:predicted ATP-dependent Lon-type protease